VKRGIFVDTDESEESGHSLTAKVERIRRSFKGWMPRAGKGLGRVDGAIPQE